MSKKRKPMSHTEITQHVVDFLFEMGYRIVCKEMHSRVTEVPDIYAVDKVGSLVIEVKSTRKDFLADQKKQFRQRPTEGLGTFRYYASYEGIINIEDLPPKWGLMWVDANGVVTVVRGKSFVHRLDDSPYWFQTNIENEYWALYSLVRKAVSWGVGDNGDWKYNKEDFEEKAAYEEALLKVKEDYVRRTYALDFNEDQEEPMRNFGMFEEETPRVFY